MNWILNMLQKLMQKAIFALEPETAHHAAITALKSGFLPKPGAYTHEKLKTHCLGLTFPNPIGMAAGFDKNAEVFEALLDLGFGFVEVGTITPRPQPGNPRPRIFRLEDDHAIINRLGFNNDGHEAAYARLSRRKMSKGIVGVNVGANKDSDDAVQDYVKGIKRFHDVADYLTINISSPNTPGLRDLQAREALERLLGEACEARESVASKKPMLLKIAPDNDQRALEDIADVVKASSIDGLIVSNTTISRPDRLQSKDKTETGGLSGRPLFALSTEVLKAMRALMGLDYPIIGVGGVENAKTAKAKMDAGANLVQLYTGFVYGGLCLPQRMAKELAEKL
jgi:dihydroorotate dehydrogenase